MNPHRQSRIVSAALHLAAWLVVDARTPLQKPHGSAQADLSRRSREARRRITPKKIILSSIILSNLPAARRVVLRDLISLLENTAPFFHFSKKCPFF